MLATVRTLRAVLTGTTSPDDDQVPSDLLAFARRLYDPSSVLSQPEQVMKRMCDSLCMDAGVLIELALCNDALKCLKSIDEPHRGLINELMRSQMIYSVLKRMCAKLSDVTAHVSMWVDDTKRILRRLRSQLLKFAEDARVEAHNRQRYVRKKWATMMLTLEASAEQGVKYPCSRADTVLRGQYLMEQALIAHMVPFFDLSSEATEAEPERPESPEASANT
jgi:hypothetical protein